MTRILPRPWLSPRIPTDNRLARKLGRFARLSAEDRAALDRIWMGPRHECPALHDLIREGDMPRDIRLIFDGWACRCKTLEDGRRQIVSYLLPGDICDASALIGGRMDHSVQALAPVRYTTLSLAGFEELMAAHPRILRAVRCDALANASIQREWALSLGQRSAIERLAHLLCELFTRLDMIGLADAGGCELPVTQVELADTLGLTAIHVGRTLKDLRLRGLIRLRDRRLEILDFAALSRVALFNPAYLHLDCGDAAPAPSDKAILFG